MKRVCAVKILTLAKAVTVAAAAGLVIIEKNNLANVDLTNHKGQICVCQLMICQEGFCSECAISEKEGEKQ